MKRGGKMEPGGFQAWWVSKDAIRIIIDRETRSSTDGAGSYISRAKGGTFFKKLSAYLISRGKHPPKSVPAKSGKIP